jgi:hypothetical protein
MDLDSKGGDQTPPKGNMEGSQMLANVMEEKVREDFHTNLDVM